MLASRFWYVLLSLLLAAAMFLLYLAESMYNRAGTKEIGERLSSDSQVVSWYLKSLARERSAQLIQFSLNRKVVGALVSASKKPDDEPKTQRKEIEEALNKLVQKVPAEFGFDAVFAVDKHGRVIGQYGFEQSRANPNFELGGYPAVADALHGYIRDDILVWDRVYMAVARPVEFQAGDPPVGAILGLRIVDDRFARDIAARTSAAVAFYSGGERIASGAPDDFDKSQLDGIITDLELLDEDSKYVEVGRSSVRPLSGTVSVMYSRLPGEAWNRGAGYVVGRKASSLSSPLAFFAMADDKDKGDANLLVVALIALLGIAGGMAFSFLEHTRPVQRFRVALEELAAGKTDQLQASKVSGVYRKLVTLINDGIDHAVAQGGGSRRAADLQQVLGEIPEQPAMSAFSFPEREPEPASDPISLPEAPPRSPPADAKSLPKPPPRMKQTMPEAGIESMSDADLSTTAPSADASDNVSEEEEWRAVYDDYIRLRRECGEATDIAYEKFEMQLRKNRDAILAKHDAARVKFAVHIKDGKAKLKASPIRG
jgi:hypothetical protein